MKTLFLTLATVASILAGAQTKDTIRVKVNGSEIIILTDDVNNLSQTDFNAIIQRLTAETQRIVADYQREVAEINRKEAEGTLTKSEATRQRVAAEEKMEDQLEEVTEEIERWADRYGEKMAEDADDPKAWKEQWEANAAKYDATQTTRVEETIDSNGNP